MSQSEQNPKRIVIAGAGRTGRALCGMLSDAWEIVVIDLDVARLDQLRAELPSGNTLSTLAKDATSLLNLREAGLDGAAWLVALTDSDEANVEICRLALSIERPPGAVGIVNGAAALEALKAVGAEAILRPGALAGIVSNCINRGVRVAISVGLGQGEVVEIPVLPSSPAADARVADLRARGWLVAAIYREGRIIVPHGDVFIRRGDRLLLSGQPEILPHIANYLRAGIARFPLQFGRRFVAIPGDRPIAGFWGELGYLAEYSQVHDVCVLQPATDPAPVLDKAITLQVEHPDVALPLSVQLRSGSGRLQAGCLVLPKKPQGLGQRIGILRPRYADLLDALPCPVLLAAGVHPYRRILLPVTDSRGTAFAADLGIDLARQLGLQMVTVTITPPGFVIGQEAIDEQKQALRRVGEVATLYNLRIEEIHREGNPITEICRLAGPGDLIVIGSRAGRRPSLFRPDTSLLLVIHAPCSVLVLSYREPAAGGVS